MFDKGFFNGYAEGSITTGEYGMKAFPRPASEAHQHGMHNPQEGMDLRDYFAAQAMTGAQIWDAVLNGEKPVFSNGIDELAKVSYLIADAMVKAREK